MSPLNVHQRIAELQLIVISCGCRAWAATRLVWAVGCHNGEKNFATLVTRGKKWEPSAEESRSSLGGRFLCG
jgi:hypothetical protein